MKNQVFKFSLLLLLLLLLHCQPTDQSQTEQQVADPEPELVDRLPDNEAGEIVRKAINWAGSLENWTSKRTLSYTKIVQYLDSTGTMEREVRQLHQYQLHPQFKARISWEDNGDQYVIMNNGQQSWKLKNGAVMTEQPDINQAWNSSFGSHYVMCMPFKLNDPGTQLEYEGLDTLANAKVVHVIKTTYAEGAGSAAGMHTWWYYFDQNDFNPVANFLDYGNGYTYTQYEAFVPVNGIQLNKERHTYRTDEDRNLKYLRTKYKNEEVMLDVDLADHLFEPKSEE